MVGQPDELEDLLRRRPVRGDDVELDTVRTGLVADPEEQVDHATLCTLVDRALFELTEVREYTWNPLAHNPGHLLYQLVTRPFAPPAERLATARSDAGRRALTLQITPA